MRPITFHPAYEPSVALPISFIDRYMQACTPVYALIYIYGLRHSMAGSRGLSTQQISEAFHILETDVLNAWKYWDAQGLVKMDTQGEGISIEFLPMPSTKPQASTPEAPKTEIPHFNISTRPQYTVEELAFYQKESKDIARLFSHGEQTLGKMLTYNDLNVLFGFYDWLRLPMDVILYMLSYCSEGGHRDLRYVEKVAMDWAERGINTVEAAGNYTASFDRDLRAIMKALGHPAAFPSPTQRKYMQAWLDEMGMPLELILEACDRTSVQIGKPTLKYINKIISDWHEKGIKTMEAVAAAESEWNKNKELKLERKASPKRRNRFANFKPRERDYAQIERMAQERLFKSSEG